MHARTGTRKRPRQKDSKREKISKEAIAFSSWSTYMTTCCICLFDPRPWVRQLWPSIYLDQGMENPTPQRVMSGLGRALSSPKNQASPAPGLGRETDSLYLIWTQQVKHEIICQAPVSCSASSHIHGWRKKKRLGVHFWRRSPIHFPGNVAGQKTLRTVCS